MKKIIFFSDVHLKRNREKRSDLLCRFLDTLLDAEAVYILGDLFDFWIGAAQIPLMECRDVFERFKSLAESGVHIYILRGNRDFLLGRTEERLFGVKVLGDAAAIKLGGKKVYLTHGDLFCTNDTDYLVLRQVFRFKPLQVAFRFLVPRQLRLLIARTARKSSSELVKRKAPKTITISTKTVKRIFKRGYDVIICGHIHEPQRILYKTRKGECELFILGEWSSEGTYVEYCNGNFSLKEFPQAAKASE